MLNWLKTTLVSFGKPNILQIKKDHLVEAQKGLLTAQGNFDYAQAMVAYNQSVITRLKKDIQEEEALPAPLARLESEVMVGSAFVRSINRVKAS